MKTQIDQVIGGQEILREAVRQQLATDRLLGVQAVPVPREAISVERNQPLVARAPIQAPRAKESALVRIPGASEPVPVAAAARSLAPGVRIASTKTGSMPLAEKAERLRVLDQTQVKSCTKCGLSASRTQTVFGQGNADARVLFVGEAPGFEEDRQGLAFVGPAGQLLTKMIAAMGLAREEVFICNVLKCRPPGNRDPLADEILACNAYLREQLQTIEPETIVALGAPAAKTLLNTAESIGRLRGRWHEYYFSGVSGLGPSIPLMPTYHPAYLLRNPADKGKAWDDLQMVMQRLGLPMPQPLRKDEA